MKPSSFNPFLYVKTATVIAAKSERPKLTANASSWVNLIKTPPLLQSKTANRTNAIGGKFLFLFNSKLSKIDLIAFRSCRNRFS